MEHIATILNHLHRAFGTITDVSALARLRTYDEIGIGPIVTEKDRGELMLAIKKKQVVEAAGRKVKLAFEGKSIFVFVNAYRDRYNALYSDMVTRQSEETDFALRRFIARKIVTEGHLVAKSELIHFSEHVDNENARLVREYRYTRDNLAEVLAQTFREYDGEKPLIEFVQERYAPCGVAERDIINQAYKISRSKKM